MRKKALDFVRRTVENQKAHMTRLCGYAVHDRQYHRDIETLILWEAILTMMEESEVPLDFPINGA